MYCVLNIAQAYERGGASAISVLKDAGIKEIDIAPNYNSRGNIYKYLERYDEGGSTYA